MANPEPSGFESLRRVRYEILPLAGVDEQLPHLPDRATVTVTSSPSRGVDATLALCERLAERRLWVVPHLAARLVRDRAHLQELLRRCDGLGIREVFVIAGDAPDAAGRYESAVDLLRELADLGHGFDDVGITGYPESHAFIPDADTIKAMADKAPHATYIVSQICYDPDTIAGWIQDVRARGVMLPVFVGVPGVVDRTRLLRISMKVGLGESVRYLRKQHGVLGRFITGYTPDELICALAPVVADPASRVRGWHLFTFNEVAKTEEWRRQLLARTQGAQA